MIGTKSSVFRFDGVEVREREFSIIKAGETSQVEPKAFRVLLFLLHNPQKLITKEELLNAVWGETAVSENSLTRSIALLRRLLGDDTHVPRYIETVATVGYRFVCKVEVSEDVEGVLAPAGASGTPHEAALNGTESAVDTVATRMPDSARWRSKRGWLAAGAVAAVVLLASAIWYLRRPLSLPRITDYAQLTLDGRKKDVIGTDGKSLFLNLVDPAGVAQLPISGGKSVPIVPDLPSGSVSEGGITELRAVSPDGSSLLVISDYSFPSQEGDLWIVGTFGRPARFLTRSSNAAWSPDGKQVVFASSHGDLYVMPSEGGEPRLLVASSAPANAVLPTRNLTWSPDGTRIRYTRDFAIWEVAADGTNLHQVIPGWRDSHFACCGRWTPDGEFFLFLEGSSLLKGMAFLPGAQIWALDEREGSLRKRNVQPFQLTSGPTLWGTPVPSRDGRKVYARGVDLRGELVRFDIGSKQLLPYLGGISAEFLSFSHDGRYVAYVTFPEGILWRANRDGTGVIQLTKPPVYPKLLRWSPDDSQILIQDYSPELQDAMYVVSAQGGTPRRLFPEDKRPETDPNWSPDGKRVIFTSTGAFSAGPDTKVETWILNLETKEVKSLPEPPGGFRSPRWSPDGRYVAGLRLGDHGVVLFDLQTQHWTSLFQGIWAGFPNWSRDGRFLYFVGRLPDGWRVFRVAVSGGRAEVVLDLRDFRWTGWYGYWFGLDPDDNPLLLRDAGTDEIYALTLEEK